MEENNHVKAMEICKCDQCPRKRQCDLGGCMCEKFESALEMAEHKDKAIKQFFIEHISPDVEVLKALSKQVKRDLPPLIKCIRGSRSLSGGSDPR